MSKMNHEHRNRMSKVMSYSPPGKPSKKKRVKRNKRHQTQLESVLGHVKMKSKYNSTCGACQGSIKPADLIWWNPEAKYVIHDNCFDKYFR